MLNKVIIDFEELLNNLVDDELNNNEINDIFVNLINIDLSHSDYDDLIPIILDNNEIMSD